MLKKLADAFKESSNAFLYLGPEEPTSNHFPEWMGGTKCSLWWIFPVKTHNRKSLVIEKELNIDYLCRVNFHAYHLKPE